MDVDKYLDHIQEIEPATLVALSAASIILSATRLYKDHFTKAARRCSNLARQDQALCLLRSKQTAKNTEMRALKSSINKCKKAKNPDKCKSKIVDKMRTINGELKFLKQRYNTIEKRSR